ncbi:MAG: dienelactone hydrolase family protein [Desulfarculus sp.]|nr:dienelactone hydrolase family protein [Desulfarculus sp.]
MQAPDGPAGGAPATCYNTRMTNDDRPPDCPGDCQPPKLPLRLPPDLLRLSFEKLRPSAQGLAAWQGGLRAKLAELLALDLAALAAWPPAWQVLQRREMDGYSLSLISFQSLEGLTVPAYLLLPRTPGPWPGVLIAHGHDLGARSAAGVIESNDGQEGLGMRLARGGLAVLAPDLLSFGQRQVGPLPDPVGRRAHEVFANFAMEVGRPIAGLHLMDLMQAQAILAAWPGVDAGRLGVAGLSQGGRLACLLAALETGLRACLVASGLTSSLLVDRGNQHLHDAVPGLLAWADYPDLAGLVAPRALMLSWGLREPFPYCVETRDLVTHNYLRPIWELAGAPENLELDLHPRGHCYNPAAALDFFARHLMAGRTAAME